MKTVSKNLLSDLENQLNEIKNNSTNTIQATEQSVNACIVALGKLKSHFLNHTFQNKTEEIEFFKIIKPELASKLLYHNEIYTIELAKPSGSNKDIRKYYKKEYTKLKTFFNDNIEFYKYYRSGNTSLDKKYFVRRKHNIKFIIDNAYFQSDHNFTTTHDYKIAQILAYDDLQIYLEEKIKKKETPITQTSKSPTLKWTGSKVAIIELIYALHTEGVFNQGNANLNEIALQFQEMFQINLTQFHRTFLEIRDRKTIDKTNFLSTLKENLNKRIQDAEEK